MQRVVCSGGLVIVVWLLKPSLGKEEEGGSSWVGLGWVGLDWTGLGGVWWVGVWVGVGGGGGWRWAVGGVG